jgi:hypothetical protein
MGSEARKILEDALALSPDERKALAHERLASQEGENDPSVDEACAVEIRRRAERFLTNVRGRNQSADARIFQCGPARPLQDDPAAFPRGLRSWTCQKAPS